MGELAEICSERGQDDEEIGWLERLLTTAEESGTFGVYWDASSFASQLAEFTFQGKLDTTRCMFERLLGFVESKPIVDKTAVFLCVSQLGLIAYRESRLPEAISYHLRATEMREFESEDAGSAILHRSQMELAASLWKVGRHEEALRYTKQALESRQQTLGASHPHVLDLERLLARFTDSGQMEAETSPTADMRVGRNQICPFCNSGKKYENCCMRKRRQT